MCLRKKNMLEVFWNSLLGFSFEGEGTWKGAGNGGGHFRIIFCVKQNMYFNITQI